MQSTQYILTSFTTSMKRSIDDAYSKDNTNDHLTAMAIYAPTIASHIIKIGEGQQTIITDQDHITEYDTDKYIIQHVWIEAAKNFMILWRNVLLEETKAYHYQKDNKISQIDMAQLLAKSHRILHDCISDLDTIFAKEWQKLGNDPVRIAQLVKSKAKQIDVWPIYQEQINQLVEQARSISNISNQIGNSNTGYKTIRRILINYFNKRKQNMSSILVFADHALQIVDEIKENSEETEIRAKIQKIEAIHQELNQLFVDNQYLEQIEKIVEEMKDKIEVPVKMKNGTLLVKNLSLKRSTQQWLESEINLALYDVEAAEDKLKNSLKMTLVNVKNRMSLMINNTSDHNVVLLTEALHKFKNTAAINADEHKSLLLKAESSLNNDFNISDIFNEQRLFMSISEQASIGTIDMGRNKYKQKAIDWLRETFSIYDNFKKRANIERRLSTSEKLVRYVDARKFSKDNNQYINVFLVKGYIGESFVIGRQDELHHFKEIYSKWKDGYRGSILITGKRYSGKSLFVEYANIKELNGNAIILQPGFEYTINGNALRASSDLKENLVQIVKQTQNSRPIVIIDDLEKWYDRNISLAANIRQLIYFIDKYSSKIFFVVTMSNWLKHKMDLLMDISKVFQADINLDRMSLEEIREVISIRQAATHKNLIDQSGTQIQSARFINTTKEIYNTTDGNVGDALAKWAFSTEFASTNTVQYVDKEYYSIPDITDTDTLLLLETIIMARKTKEYYLNKIFGNAFGSRYSALLQRLINTGLITRDIENMIQVNPHVVNDVGKLLEKKNFIKFNHR